MERRPRRVAVVHNPQPRARARLRRAAAGADVSIAGEAASGAEMLDLVRTLPVDLLVTTPQGLAEARAAALDVTAIVVADSVVAGQVDEAFDAGASAYVLETARADDLTSAIRQAFVRTVFTAPRGRRTAAALPATEADASLTRREREILTLVAVGRSNGEIARLLWVTDQTVKFHLRSVYRKLGVRNRAEAGRWARSRGLIVGDAAVAA